MSIGSGIFLGLFLVATTIIVAVFLRRRPENKPEITNFAEKMIGQLSQRLEAMQQSIDSNLKENRQTTSEAAKRASDEVAGFSRGIVSLEKEFRQLHEKVDKVTSFQDLFKTPKTTGKWGEAQLSHILGEYFDRDLWEVQHYFKNKEAVDAVVKLPNDKLLPIDSKLNFVSFEKMVNTSGPDYEAAKRDFVRAVKEEIDSIASKYINPAEKTMDVAVMFVSAESVYYEIVNRLRDDELIAYAWKKRVVLASPNTLYITLQTFRHWSAQMNLQKNLEGIFDRLEGIKRDAVKLQEEFRKLGTHIGNVDKTYREFDHRLELLTDRVQKVIGMGDELKEGEKQGKVVDNRLLE